jgi:hypothetical protein
MMEHNLEQDEMMRIFISITRQLQSFVFNGCGNKIISNIYHNDCFLINRFYSIYLSPLFIKYTNFFTA